MAGSAQTQGGIKTHFKTPEGRYKLANEKTHPTGMMYYTHHRAPTKVTLAHLKDRPQSPTRPPPPPSSSRSFVPKLPTFSSSSNSKSASLFGVSGSLSSRLGVGSRHPSVSGTSTTAGIGPLAAAAADAEGTYLVFNVGESLFVSDYNTADKDPIKSIHFPTVRSLCHAFNTDAKDGHDILIGTDCGDVYSASLRLQLQDGGRKLIGANHLNKDGVVCNSRVTCVAWVPKTETQFIAAHADGNMFVYDTGRDGIGEVQFPPLKDASTFSVARARTSKSNPLARWHICSAAINDIAFSADGHYLATASRDGYLRVFDWNRETLLCGCKSYYGAVLCCAFSPDAKYVLFGGEDDLVHVWSMEDQRVVAWCEGHGSWVSSVSFDPFWRPPTHDLDGPTPYRFASVAQDAQLLLWDLSLDEVVVPLRRLPSANSSPSPPSRPSSTATTPSQPADAPSTPSTSAARPDFSSPISKGANGVLRPHPSRKDVPKVAPIMAHKVHTEPLADIIFCKDSIITTCYEGHIKVWLRPPADSEGIPVANGEGALVGGGSQSDVRMEAAPHQKLAVR